MNASKYYGQISKRNTKAFLELDKIFGEYAIAPAVEPVSLIAAIETGYKLYSLFKKKEGKKDELVTYLQKEFGFLRALLLEVLDRLDELKVLVKSEIRGLTVNNLDGALTRFNQSYDTWWRYPNRPQTKDEAMSELLPIVVTSLK
jgi:hypothetical protein